MTSKCDDAKNTCTYVQSTERIYYSLSSKYQSSRSMARRSILPVPSTAPQQDGNGKTAIRVRADAIHIPITLEYLHHRVLDYCDNDNTLFLYHPIA